MLIKIFLFTILLFSLIAPEEILAQQQNCTQVYGGGVVCGIQAPPVHKPVPADIGDFKPLNIGLSLLAVSITTLYVSKKMKYTRGGDNNE